MRQAAAAENLSYPPVLFIFQGSVSQGQSFFNEYWPEARAIADPRRRLYAYFGIKRGGMKQVFGLQPLLATTKALQKGYTPSNVHGDPWLMPGMFLVYGDEILWQHRFEHIGDHPDFTQIPGLVESLQTS